MPTTDPFERDQYARERARKKRDLTASIAALESNLARFKDAAARDDHPLDGHIDRLTNDLRDATKAAHWLDAMENFAYVVAPEDQS